jgi:signal transduction histidine kinase
LLASDQIDESSEFSPSGASGFTSELSLIVEAVSQLTTLASSKDQNDLARQAVETIAKRMKSDYCLLLTMPDRQGHIGIVAGYDLSNQSYFRDFRVDSTDIPIINDALLTWKNLVIPSKDSQAILHALKPIIPRGFKGPALFNPLVAAGEIMGGFLLLSNSQHHKWSSEDQEILEVLTALLGQRFQELRHINHLHKMREKVSAIEKSEERIRALEKEKRRLEKTLEGHASESSNLKTMEAMIAKQDDERLEIERLQKEIVRLNKELSEKEGASAPNHIEDIIFQRQFALQELAETRNYLEKLKMEGSGSQEPSSGKFPEMEKVAAITQELRQKVASVLGYTEILLGESVGLLGAMQHKFLERVQIATQRMANLLNDLGEVNPIEASTQAFGSGQVIVMNCVEEAIAEVSEKMREKRTTLRMITPDEHPLVHGDGDAVTQIFYHLFENAIEASPVGGEITFTFQEQDLDSKRFAMYSVTDQGDGIAPDDIARVFQRAYTSERISIPGVGDQGVGLSIVKSLCEKLGGRLWVDSELGKGSNFSVLLPVAESDSKVEAAISA